MDLDHLEVDTDRKESIRKQHIYDEQRVTIQNQILLALSLPTENVGPLVSEAQLIDLIGVDEEDEDEEDESSSESDDESPSLLSPCSLSILMKSWRFSAAAAAAS